jgi:hypothetical protein
MLEPLAADARTCGWTSAPRRLIEDGDASSERTRAGFFSAVGLRLAGSHPKDHAHPKVPYGLLRSMTRTSWLGSRSFMAIAK